jgi:hypothetical protein
MLQVTHRPHVKNVVTAKTDVPNPNRLPEIVDLPLRNEMEYIIYRQTTIYYTDINTSTQTKVLDVRVASSLSFAM